MNTKTEFQYMLKIAPDIKTSSIIRILSLIVLLQFFAMRISFAETLKIEGTVLGVEHSKSLITVSTGKSLITNVFYSGKTRFVNAAGGLLPLYSIMPGDHIVASIPVPVGIASSVVINGETAGGELVFISAVKFLTSDGIQVQLSKDARFYINGIETEMKDLQKGRRVFARTDPETDLAGIVYQADINKRVMKQGETKAVIKTVECFPAGSFRKGKVIKIVVTASPGKKVSADIAGAAYKIPLKETKPGVYSGSYTFTRTDIRRTYIIARASDNKGTVTRINTTAIDAAVSPPVIEPVYPLPDKTVDGDGIELFARLSSPGSLIKANSIEVFLDGKQLTSGVERNVGFVSCDLPLLKKGKRTMKVLVMDEAGNKASLLWQFTVK